MNGHKDIQKAYKSILDHDFEQAIDFFERAIRQEPNNAAYHYKLSITFARSNKLNKAIEYAEKAYQLNPNLIEVKYHLQNLQAKMLVQQAEQHFNRGLDQLHLSVALLKQAIALDPLAVEAYLLISMAYDQLGEYDKAINMVQEVLKLEPNHEHAVQLLDELKLKLKQYLNSSN